MLIFTLFACPHHTPESSKASLFGFESDDALGNSGWSAGITRGALTEGISMDETVVHRGERSLHIERTAESKDKFSSINLSLPLEVEGHHLTLRGWLRLEGVNGWAGLWQRQDGSSGTLQFDNMANRELNGTIDWKEYEVRLPLDPNARTVTFGALLVGEGKIWLDDVRLFIDGKPIENAAPKSVPLPPRPTRGGVSGIADLDAPSPAQIANLALLGRVWGFVKYHHPKVTGASVAIDDQLFEALPAVLAAETTEAGQAAIDSWVASLGEPDPCKPCASIDGDLALAPPIEWLKDRALLGEALSARLQKIYAARTVAPQQAYVSLVEGVGNPDFSNEERYETLTLPDAGARLLAVFRFWNVVTWWSPYRDLVEGSWEEVLTEFVPKALAKTSPDDYRRMLISLIARSGDSHANLWSSLKVRPPFGEHRLPVIIRPIEGRPVVTGYTDATLGPATGLLVGDVLTSIDGTPTEALWAQWRPLYAGSNRAAIERDLARDMTRGPAGPVVLGVLRKDGPVEIQAERQPDIKPGSQYHDFPGAPVRRLSEELAYITLSEVAEGGAESYIREALGAKALIIDIRNYPSSFMVFDLGQRLIEQRSEFVRFTLGQASNPGAFAWSEPLALAPQSPRFEGKVAILVDEMSQSQAEYTTMAFRTAPGAIVVGSTTAGADGNVSELSLPGGERTLISGIGVFYPDKRPTQRIGILPDLAVSPTIEAIRAGRDEVLEAAVRALLQREITAEEQTALRAPPKASP